MTPTQLSLDPAILKPNPWNTNHVSPDNQAKLDEAISRLGMFKPIVVRELEDGGFEILGGEHRRDSAVRLGINPVPVICVGRIDEKLAKEIGLADNARYGTDDMLSLAGLLESLGEDEHDLATFLPYTDTDLKAIFSTVNIDVDSLDFDENDADDIEIPEPATAKAPKTHTVMRFKVAISDSERLAKLIKDAQKRFGFTEDDELTNAGDALVHLLLGTVGDGDEA